jgi:hypothetical protein
MNELDHMDRAGTPLNASHEVAALIASLRAAGADRFDAVRWHYVETLAGRATAQRGSARRALEIKLTQALTALRQRFASAQCAAREILERDAQRYPHAASKLQQLFAAGDFKGLQRYAAALEAGEQRASLSALVQQLEQQAPEAGETQRAGNAAPRSELKVIRNFRKTWSKLSVDKQLAQALEQAPRNAGPINSHMLVLRSLAMMRDISPDYLNRFISYADTLLCLDQGEKERAASPKKQQTARAGKK